MTETKHEKTSDPAVLMARQSLYRFAALSLLDPQADSWEQLEVLRDDALLSEAAALVRNLSEAKQKKRGPGERPLSELDPARVLARLPESWQQFNEKYENTFGLLVSNACPPYETEYINSKYAFQRSNTMADVSGFYFAFGLTTSVAHPERPDHIVQELEFMAFLIGMERQAAGGEDVTVRRQRLEVCRDAQTRFLREHLSWWAPVFAKLLSREDPDGFYAAAGAFLAALIPAERAWLRVELTERPAEPSTLERPEVCEGCELVS
jgi:TorA maturation chaperone TorD